MITELREWSEARYEIQAKGFMQTVFKTALAIGEPYDLLKIGRLMGMNAMTQAVRKNKGSIPNAQELLDEIQDQRTAEEAGIESLSGLIKNFAQSSMTHLFDTSGDRRVLKLSEARKTGAVAYFALPALV